MVLKTIKSQNDENEYVSAAFLNLSKALESLPFEIKVSKLQHKFAFFQKMIRR